MAKLRQQSSALATAIIRHGEQVATLAKVTFFYGDFSASVDIQAQAAINQRSSITGALTEFQTSILADVPLQEALAANAGQQVADHFSQQVTTTPAHLLPAT
jgi:hypothetical protein